MSLTLLALLVMAGCGEPATSQVIPTATLAPTPCPVTTETPLPTATVVPSPSPIATHEPGSTPIPTRPPTPTPTQMPVPTPISPCVPPPGVQGVSAAEIDQGTTSRLYIALTFDAGGPVNDAAQILDILAKHHLHVTWFVTGQWALDNPDLLRRVHTDGHEIGNHTMTHPDLTTLPDMQVCQELTEADQVIARITGQTTRPYFRPPYGARNAHVRTLAANLGYRTVYWTIDTIDWRSDATPQSITDRVLNNLDKGAIVLMHAGSIVEAQTLDGLITAIEQRGYQIVTLTQLLQ